jgi:aspartate/methionine/tyrosine aminotransferase
MVSLDDKFRALSTDYAPGQETRQVSGNIGNLKRGPDISGTLVDFSHGDVDAFPPAPGALAAFLSGVEAGGRQAYTEYRGSADIRNDLADKLARFTGAPVSGDQGLIITPGTQGALFLAMAATVAAGQKVAIVEPDYFANRKLVRFFGGEIVPIQMHYQNNGPAAGIDLDQLETAFEAGAKLFVFSNPNNPTGTVYSAEEIGSMGSLANKFGATVIADQLYSRLLYRGTEYAHLRVSGIMDGNVLTIMGPSKTESLSGYRLGVAFGARGIVERMEKLQAIVSLRAPGYSQAVLRDWFNEPPGWLDERARSHQEIRDDLVEIFRAAGFETRVPQGGSYLFPQLPALDVSLHDFIRLLRHQANVIVTPGTEFESSASLNIRINFSQDRAAAVSAVKRLVKLADRYRS